MIAPVSVVIPCHTERRWESLGLAVRSALAQDPAPAEVVVTVDHNDALLERARRELSGATVVENKFPRGASGNRNTGVLHTRTPVVALLDDDARAHPGWLAGLAAPFSDPDVVGTGGAIRPDWARKRPYWFPDEFLWVVGASYTGMPAAQGPIRNVWSESMAVRRDVFDVVGGFRVDFGKVGDRSRPEDTDLCLRMTAASGGHWVYVPDAVIDHAVPVERSTLRFFLKRCSNEGRAKVEMARLNDGRRSLGAEQSYLRALPRAVGAGLRDASLGRGAARAGQACALVAGAAAAALGAAVGVVSMRRRQDDTPATAGPDATALDPGPATAGPVSAVPPGPELVEEAMRG